MRLASLVVARGGCSLLTRVAKGCCNDDDLDDQDDHDEDDDEHEDCDDW